MYYLFLKKSFQCWDFSLLTTSLACLSAQGAIVQKPRRRAASGVNAIGKDRLNKRQK